MRTILWKNILPILCAFGMVTAAHVSHALDAPHNAAKTITCDTCHIATASTPSYLQGPYTGDESFSNNLCMNCHNASNPQAMQSEYSNVLTHSSYQTGTAKGYGTWKVECVTCHHPHNQKQASVYLADPLSSVVSGTQSGAGTGTTLTVNTVLSANTLTNHLLIPNTVYPAYMYRITGNTTNVITVAAAVPGMPAVLRGAGKSFAVKYGKMTKESITVRGMGNIPMKFFNDHGPNSFADSDTEVTDGICQVCHTQTASFNNSGTLENGHPPNKAGTDCTSCHTHDKGFKADCAVCHGSPPMNSTPGDPNGLALPATGSTTPGKHEKHAVDLGINCEACHKNFVMPEVSKTIDIGFSFGANQGHYDGQATANYQGRNGTTVGNTGTRTCSNIYCHSNAKIGTGEIMYSPVVWDVSSPAMTCNSCHTTTPQGPAYVSGGAGVATSNSHTYHVGGPNANAPCSSCHDQTVLPNQSLRTDIDPSKHVNAVANVDFDSDGVYNGNKSCSATTCHGTASPQWGRNTANQVCTKCHGRLTTAGTYTLNDAAPGAGGTGISTGGSSANTNAKVGAHRAHLEATHSYSIAVQCSVCHTVPAAYSSNGHIYDGTNDTTKGIAEVVFSGLATTNPGGAAGVPAYAISQCSNVYCHDSTRFKNAYGGGTTASPSWNAPFLNSDPADCATCHGFPPTGAHPAEVNCTACHPHVNETNDGFKALNTPASGGIERHANGLVEGGGCDGCHGNPPTLANLGGGALSGLATPATNATNPLSPGAHNNHVNANPANGRNIQCDACHYGTAMPLVDKRIDIGFKIDGTTYPGFAGVASTGTFTGMLNANLFNGNEWFASAPGTTIGQANDYLNTCSVYCHGGGTTGKAALTGGTNRIPSWVGGSSQAECGTCHGAGTSFATTAASPPTTGAHVQHASTASDSVDLACNKCHPTPAYTLAHVDGNVEWSLDQTDVRIAGAIYKSASSGSTNALAPSASYGSCDTLYCHSNVQTSPPGGAVTYKQLSWSGSVSCGDCHKSGPSGGGAEQDSGSHLTHVSASKYNFACSKCHQGSGSGTIDHVNHIVNVSINSGGSATYSGTPTPGDAYGSCSMVYCHSTVQEPGGNALPSDDSYATPDWGSAPMNCGSCHTDMSTTEDLTLGTHKRHTNEVGINYACSLCHGAPYSATTVSYAVHANGNIDTKFTGTAAGTTYSQAGVNAPGSNGYGTCSTSKCHGRDTKNWGTYSNLVTCEKCHGSLATAQTGSFRDTANSTGSVYAGTHVSHLAGIHNYSDPIACDQCHKVPSSVNDAGHMSGVPADLTWGALSTAGMPTQPAPTYSGAPGRTCSNTYCHTRGGSNQSPAWGDPSYLGGTGCGKCHGNPPSFPHIANTNCRGCHDHVDVSNTSFVVDYVNPDFSHINGKSLHVNGAVNVSQDDCLACHSSLGLNALIGAHPQHTDANFLSVSFATGTATGGTTNTLTDTNHTMVDDEFKNMYLYMTSGPSTTYVMKISGNTVNTLTLATAYPASILAGQTYDIRNPKKQSNNDYDDPTWLYDIAYVNGFPRYACGFCHPNNASKHRNGIVDLDMDPTHSAAGTVKTKNAPTNQFQQTVSGSNVTCIGVYCHSNGYVSPATDQYAYKTTPNWYTANSWAAVDRCAQCHGNSPNTSGTVGSPAHAKHVIAVHYNDVYTGTSGTLSLSGASGSGAVHGDPATSGTINCNLCHNSTVKVAYNDKNGICVTCHTGGAAKGAAVVDSTNNNHVNGNVDVAFPAGVFNSKAQVRNDITTVAKLNENWTRTNGYKASNASYDESKSTSAYIAGTCASISCHNGTTMQWNAAGPLSCSACHKGLAK